MPGAAAHHPLAQVLRTILLPLPHGLAEFHILDDDVPALLVPGDAPVSSPSASLLDLAQRPVLAQRVVGGPGVAQRVRHQAVNLEVAGAACRNFRQLPVAAAPNSLCPLLGARQSLNTPS